MSTIAIVGCAHIHTPGFIRMITKREGAVKVKSVWDHHAVRGEQRAKELGAAFTTDLASIANDKDISAVVICSETDRHEPLVLQMAAAKKHLFVEKPLGAGKSDSEKMAAAIEAAGVKFQTGYFMRGNPVVMKMKQLADEGFFGKITRIRGSNVHQGALGGWFDAKPNDPASDWLWMTDVKQSGVGAFGDLGTHALDLMLWIAGDVASVTATTDIGTNRYNGCDETGEGLLRFKNGAIGSIAAAWLDWQNPTYLLISGTKAHAHMTHGKLHVNTADGSINGEVTDLPPGLPHAFDLFLDAVDGKNVPLVGVREAAYRSTVMEQLYKAAAAKSWIDL
jgi:predicted dehydrogenase